MKKIAVLLCSLFIGAIVIVNPVSAHVLETDGTIGAVFHIQPDDNPTAGTETTYQFSFADTSNKFTLSDCDCRVSIKLNDKLVDTTSLAASQSLVSTNSYTFQTAGVYTLTVQGKPKSDPSFNPFELSYSVRVRSGAQMNAQPFPLTLGIGFALMIVLLLLAAVKADGMMEKNND